MAFRLSVFLYWSSLFLLLSSSEQMAAGTLSDLIESLEVKEAIEEQQNPNRFHIAVAAIFQNEASYLQEWIEDHKMIGVEYF